MKNLSLVITLLAFFTIAIAISCSDETANMNQDIHGSWILKEYLADPGDGSGKWQPSTTSTTILFSSPDSFSSDQGFYSDYIKFKTTGTQLTLYKITNDSIRVNFTLKDNNLELRPFCIEGCGYRFERAIKQP